MDNGSREMIIQVERKRKRAKEGEVKWVMEMIGRGRGGEGGGVGGGFFFNDTATTEIYTLSLHDALPICEYVAVWAATLKKTWSSKFAPLIPCGGCQYHRLYLLQSTPWECEYLAVWPATLKKTHIDRKSTRLNSSHRCISYAVFCLKKKNNKIYFI